MRHLFAVLLLCVVAFGQEPLVTARVHTNMVPVVQSTTLANAANLLQIAQSENTATLPGVTDLSSYTGAATRILTLGYSTAGDGGDSIWTYSASLPSWAAATNVAVIARPGGGYWIPSGNEINAGACGLIGASLSSSSVPFTNLLTIASMSSKNLYLPPGRYRFDNYITLTQDNVAIRGAGTNLTVFYPSTNIGNFFSDTQSQFVTNGAFTASNGWTFGTGWTYSGSNAVHTAGNTDALTNATSAVSGSDTYTIRFTVSGMTAGSVELTVGSVSRGTYATNGTYVIGSAEVGVSQLSITPSSDFDGTIDDVHCTANPGNTQLFLVNGANNLRFSDIWFDGNYYPVGDSRRLAIDNAYKAFFFRDSGGYGWVFKDCFVTGWRHSFIHVNSLTTADYAMEINGCRFVDACLGGTSSDNGVVETGYADGFRAINCEFYNCGSNWDTSHSLYLNVSTSENSNAGSLVSGCLFVGSDSPAYPTFHYNPSTELWAYGPYASGNLAYKNTQPKIASTYGVVTGNQFRFTRPNAQSGLWTGNAFYEAFVYVGAGTVNFVGNSFAWNAEASPSVNTSRISAGGNLTGVSIIGNRFHSQTRLSDNTTLSSAILLTSGNDGWQIIGNSFDGVMALHCGSAVNGVTFANNQVINPSWTSTGRGLVNITAGTNIVVRDNVITSGSGKAYIGPTGQPMRAYYNNRIVGSTSSASLGVLGDSFTMAYSTNHSELARLYVDLTQTTNSTVHAANEKGGAGVVPAVMADAATAPTTMSTGWLYRDTASGGNSPYKIYNGTEWVSISPGLLSTASSATAITGVGSTISAAYTMARLDPNGNYTLTSTPTISDGLLGQRLTIIVPIGEANTVTIQDEDTLANSNVQLGSTARTLGAGDVLVLVFDGTYWIEESFANN